AYYQFGAYQLQLELLRSLFPDGEDKPPKVSTKRSQSWTANGLANSYAASGQSANAVRLFLVSAELDESDGDKENLAISLGNVARQQLAIGALSAAERNLRRKIDLCREIADEYWEASGHHELVRVLSYCGKWQDAEQQQDQALSLVKKLSEIQPEGTIWLYSALRFLLMAREETIFDTRKSNNEYQILALRNVEASAIESAQRALELADKNGLGYPVPRDYVRAYWLLGAAYCANNELTLAEENLSKALNLCRQINAVDAEADILLDLARLSFAYALRAERSGVLSLSKDRSPSAPQKSTGTSQDRLQYFQDAQEKASEALMITERSGYVLQGADVNLFLAQYALEQEKDKAKAKQYAETALKLAHCDDGPPYYYKVAYEEAERFLEKLK
ncbi:MAG: hypothetical protein MUO77_06760, partial [Anaerolineales bacterium]|nr:hypothetical protein [Anaerolineales bacterium]